MTGEVRLPAPSGSGAVMDVRLPLVKARAVLWLAMSLMEVTRPLVRVNVVVRPKGSVIVESLPLVYE